MSNPQMNRNSNEMRTASSPVASWNHCNAIATTNSLTELQRTKISIMIKIKMIMKMKKVICQEQMKERLMEMKTIEMAKLRLIILKGGCTPKQGMKLRKLVKFKLMMKMRKMIHQQNIKLMHQERMMIMMLRNSYSGRQGRCQSSQVEVPVPVRQVNNNE